jgi:hypothetical protein
MTRSRGPEALRYNKMKCKLEKKPKNEETWFEKQFKDGAKL